MSLNVNEPWPPVSIEAAKDEILTVTAEIEAIQAQMSQKNHQDERGNRLGDHEYHQWRARALYARQKKLERLRRLKTYVRAVNLEAVRIAAGVPKPVNVVELLGALVAAFRDAVASEDRTDREKALLDLAERWLQTRGAPATLRAKQTALSASA